MKNGKALLLLAAALVVGMGCRNRTTSLEPIEDIKITNEGKFIEITLNVWPEHDYVVFKCDNYDPFDTLYLTDSVVHNGTVVYNVDSTFLLTCESHSLLRVEMIGVGEYAPMIIELSNLGASASLPAVVLADRDTVFLDGDSSGYTVRTSEYVRVRRYAGEIYAPLPPAGYDTLLNVGPRDTLVVWHDYDRDGVQGYDGDDIFWVVILGDSVKAKTLTILDKYFSLTGYRGLDLCFKCMDRR